MTEDIPKRFKEPHRSDIIILFFLYGITFAGMAIGMLAWGLYE